MSKPALFAFVTALSTSTLAGLQFVRAETSSHEIGGTLFQQSRSEGRFTRIHDREGYNWQFLACVRSADDCSHRAHGSGYNKHRVEHEEENCEDRPHLACYGK